MTKALLVNRLERLNGAIQNDKAANNLRCATEATKQEKIYAKIRRRKNVRCLAQDGGGMESIQKT
jgi:hypothetical protein